MKLIMEQWRGFLQEGRYEAATTELTRKVIPHVKYIIDEVIPEIIEKNPRKDLILVIGKKYQAGKGLPKELKDFFYNELRDKYIAFAKTKYPAAVGI